MALCTYSKSEVYREEVLTECPMGIGVDAARKCFCKTREYRNDLRVAVCLFPKTWNGQPIHSIERTRETLERIARDDRRKRSQEKLNAKENETMATDTQATQAADTAAAESDNRGSELAVSELVGGTGHAVTIYDRFAASSSFMMALANAFEKSRMFGCKNKEQGFIMAIACVTERQSPIELQRKYHIINGGLSMKSDVMLAEFHRLGGKCRMIERSSEVARAEFSYNGIKYDLSCTWEEVRQEPYPWKDGKVGDKLQPNYSTPRKRMQMLWARLISDSIRFICPEVNGGQYTPEELADESGESIDAIEGSFTVQSETPAATDQAADATPTEQVPAVASQEQLKELTTALGSVFGDDRAKWQVFIERIQPGLKSATELTTENAAKAIQLLQEKAEALSGAVHQKPEEQAAEVATEDQLQRVLHLKNAAQIDDATWQQVRGRLGLAEGKSLAQAGPAAVANLINWLETKVPKSELDNWAEGALSGKA